MRNLWPLLFPLLLVADTWTLARPAAVDPQTTSPPAGRALERLVRQVGLAPEEVGLELIDAASGRRVLALGAERAWIPASTLKLVTCACALERLGPAAAFTTEFLALEKPAGNGELAGPLFVRGGGDPALRAEDIWVAMRELGALGLSRVGGGLVLDDELLGPPGVPPSWPVMNRSDPYAAPQGALSLAWDSIQLVVRPASTAGGEPRVTTFPLRAGARIDSRLVTGPAGSKARWRVRTAAGGELVLEGSLPAAGEVSRRWVHLGDPALVAGEALREAAASAGIEIEGPARRGTVPSGAVLLLAHRSRPLAELVRGIGKFSNNFGAEILLRHLTRSDRGGDPLRSCLDAWGAAAEGDVLADGSGLSRSNRLRATTLARVLLAADHSPSWGAELLSALPLAGVDGTLERRLTPLRGRLRAKTGTLAGVAGLAGVLHDRSGRRLVLALLVNRPGAPAGDLRRSLDRLVLALDGLLEHLPLGGEESADPGEESARTGPALDRHPGAREARPPSSAPPGGRAPR